MGDVVGSQKMSPGLDYWTKLFSFYGEVYALIFRKKPTVYS